MDKKVLILGLGLLLASNMSASSVKKEQITIHDIVDDLPKHPSKPPYSKRQLSQIQAISVHHSDSDNQTAYDHANYHVGHHEWPGIAYHIVIEYDGEIYLTNYFDTVSYHTKNNNTALIGICLSGDYEHKAPSNAQLDSLDRIIEDIRLELGWDIPVNGHRDYRNTTCPGDSIYNYIQRYN